MAGGRRSAKSLPGVRRTRFGIFLTDEEKMQIRSRAKHARMSMSHYLIQCALRNHNGVTFAELEAFLDELKDFRNQIIKVGTNLNQVAHHANTTSEIPLNFEDTTREVQQCLMGVNEFLRTKLGGSN